MPNYKLLLLMVMVAILLTGCQQGRLTTGLSEMQVDKVIDTMVAAHGAGQRTRIETGVRQVAGQWQEEDGSYEDFSRFCRDNFIADEIELLTSFQRVEAAFESINGHLTQLRRELQWNLDVDTGPLQPVDYLLGNLSLGSHLNDDLYSTRLAFWVLLNYPVPTLQDCLDEGSGWSRREWAEARLAQSFAARVPAAAAQAEFEAYVTADTYINGYNFFMHNLLTADGQRLFPEDLRLVSHWGIRDELKSQYAQPGGLPKQELIQELMYRIIKQQVPQVVVDNPEVEWTMASNVVSGSSSDNSPEPDTRYQHLRNYYLAVKQADPYHPSNPSFVDRAFNLNREIPEATVRELFDKLLSAPELKQTAAVIRKRLGRELQPFDIWYNGFRSIDNPDHSEMNRITTARYPSAAAFRDDIPRILEELGFDPETAAYLKTKIEVDASRGIGHAAGAGRRSDNAHLRTRVPETGMPYRGYNIAMHELGHNVEQVFGVSRIDHTLLEGVPNPAFTEAFAMLFQARDLEILGVPGSHEKNPYQDLHNLWATCEIAAVSLLDMNVWNWMYDTGDFTATELKQAVVSLSQELWNRYYAPVIGIEDSPLLAIYSHMIDNGLYLPNYTLGHIIQSQLEEYLHNKDLGPEMERMCTIGNVTPDHWMQTAVGEQISVGPILRAARRTLAEL